MSITQVPRDVMTLIFSFCEGKTLARCKRVLKPWNECIKKNPLFLTTIYSEKQSHYIKLFKVQPIDLKTEAKIFNPKILGFIASTAQLSYQTIYLLSGGRMDEEVLHLRSSYKDCISIESTNYILNQQIDTLKIYSDKEIIYSIDNTIWKYDASQSKKKRFSAIVQPAKKTVTPPIDYLDVMEGDIFYVQGQTLWVCKPQKTSQSITVLPNAISYMKCLKASSPSASSYILTYNEKKEMDFYHFPIEQEKNLKFKFNIGPDSIKAAAKIENSIFFITDKKAIYSLSHSHKLSLDTPLREHTEKVTELAQHQNMLISFSAGEICFWKVHTSSTTLLYKFNEALGLPKSIKHGIVIQRNEDECFSLLCASKEGVYLLSSFESFCTPFAAIKKENWISVVKKKLIK